MVSTSPRARAEKGSSPELEGVPGPQSRCVASEETEICPNRKGTLHRLCFEILSGVQWLTFKAPLGFDAVRVESVPVFVSSTSQLHSSSTAGMFWTLGAGCTQVGTWLVLGKSSTRLSGSSSSLYVHANCDRMTLSLVWNKQWNNL